MSTASVTLTDFGEVHHVLLFGPGIRSHGYFDPEAAAAQTYAVDRITMQVIRDELVVSLKVVVSDIEVDGLVLALRSPAQDVDGFPMPLHQRWNQRSHKWLFDYLGQRFTDQQRDQARQKAGIVGGFNHHRQLQGRRSHLYSHFGRAEL